MENKKPPLDPDQGVVQKKAILKNTNGKSISEKTNIFVRYSGMTSDLTLNINSKLYLVSVTTLLPSIMYSV